jgi:fructokinase
MIVVCGEALVDLTPVRIGVEEAYLPHPGGSPYNVAIALGRLDVPVAFLGRLSHDAFGRLLRRHLVSSGVDVAYVREGTEPTTLAFVHLAGDAEPEYSFYGEGAADQQLLPEHLPQAFPEDVVALHFGSISLVREPSGSTLELLQRRERQTRMISFDPNVRPHLIADMQDYRHRLEGWIAGSDIVKASRADISYVYPGDPVDRVAARWRTLGPALVVVTLGPEGALGVAASGVTSAPGMAAKSGSTVGAGDAFTAGLLAWLAGRGLLSRPAVGSLPVDDIGAALAFANRIAGEACAPHG